MLRLWNGCLFPQGPRFWETWRDALFLRAFEIKRYVKRYVKMPCKQVPVGEPGGDLLAGTIREKRIVYLGSFLGPRGH
jgi:hypothetical protein